MLALSLGRSSSLIARRAIVDAKPLQVRPPAMQLPLALGWKWAQKQSHNLKHLLHFSTQASSGGSESPLINSMNLKIKEQLNAQSVTVTDASGDGRHVSISVVSESFEGKSQVNRQRMVYKVIWEELQTTVHAVDHMSTKTPQEADSSSD